MSLPSSDFPDLLVFPQHHTKSSMRHSSYFRVIPTHHLSSTKYCLEVQRLERNRKGRLLAKLFFFFFGLSEAYEVPGWDQIQAADVTYTTAEATLDPLTHWARPGTEPASQHCRDAADPVAPQQEFHLLNFLLTKAILLTNENWWNSFTQKSC